MTNFNYDVFISFSHIDRQKVLKLASKLEACGLVVFCSEKSMTSGISFQETIQKALTSSQHFVLYYSKDASESVWVNQEWKTFLNEYHIKDPENRRMYILCDKNSEESIPAFLKDLQRPKTDEHLLAELTKYTITSTRKTTNYTPQYTTDFITSLEEENRRLRQENQKLREAQYYYRHYRFWRPIADNGNIHIFTCGRDIPHDSTSTRGTGGRTNIDVWDYRSVLDIYHFFALEYPNTKITVEDPTSKLHGSDIEDNRHLVDRINHMKSKLADKDCIIVGSPDVSDYAEITLADIHKIEPYSEGRKKKKGFVLIKEKKHTTSSFYWQKEGQEGDGVAQILGEGQYKYYLNESSNDHGLNWKMYGILIVAKNPFQIERGRQKRKIIILSGFSGIATNAIAKLITDELYIEEFYKLDNEFEHLENDIEVLVGIEYAIDRDFKNRDTREIKAITFEKLVEI